MIAKRVSRFIDPKDQWERLGWHIACHGLGDRRNAKARPVIEAINANIDLKNCEYDELLELWGFGRKMASQLLMHSRPGVFHSTLDSHVLLFLNDNGVVAPSKTPNNKSSFLKFEELFLGMVPKDRTPHEFEEHIRREYLSGRKVINV